MNKLEYNINNIKGEATLVRHFNERQESAFSFIYMLYYDSLYMFTSRLYRNTEVDAADVIHDIFLSIWNKKNGSFSSVNHIKDYLFLSVRNRFRKYIEHQKSVDKYSEVVNNDNRSFITDMVEVEVVSKLSLMLDALPEGYAEVLKLYVEGMEIKEIAESLNKPIRTVYHQKNEALIILKKKFTNSTFAHILMLLN